MASNDDIKFIKIALEQLENDIKVWNSDEDDNIDYEDLKKRIYNLQATIKSIVEFWEE